MCLTHIIEKRVPQLIFRAAPSSPLSYTGTLSVCLRTYAAIFQISLNAYFVFESYYGVGHRDCENTNAISHAFQLEKAKILIKLRISLIHFDYYLSHSADLFKKSNFRLKNI